MTSPQRRRASAGNTHEPFPCCGKEAGTYGRLKGTICLECRDLIREGAAARKALPASLDVYAWTAANYSWPAFYGTGANLPGDVHDRLKVAFWTLINKITTPAPANTPSRPDGGEWPKFLTGGTGQHWDHCWRTLVLAEPSLRAAVDDTYQTIWAALAAAHHAGKKRGGSALFGLASGELSLSDFEEATLPPREQRR